MSAPPPAGHRTGANRWERAARCGSSTSTRPRWRGPWRRWLRTRTRLRRSRGPGRGRAVSIYRCSGSGCAAEEDLAFVVCYPTGLGRRGHRCRFFLLIHPPTPPSSRGRSVGGTCGTVALLNALLNAPGVALRRSGSGATDPRRRQSWRRRRCARHDRCCRRGGERRGRAPAGTALRRPRQSRERLPLARRKRSAPVGAGPRSKKGAKRELRKLVDAVLDARPDALFSVVALVDTAPRPRRPPALGPQTADVGSPRRRGTGSAAGAASDAPLASADSVRRIPGNDRPRGIESNRTFTLGRCQTRT